MALNIAEGDGKRSVADRVRYLEIASGPRMRGLPGCVGCSSEVDSGRCYFRKNDACSDRFDDHEVDREAAELVEHEHEHEHEHESPALSEWHCA